jgi:hypothetical protein
MIYDLWFLSVWPYSRKMRGSSNTQSFNVRDEGYIVYNIQEILRYIEKGGKKSWAPPAILSCGKDLDDLLISINIVVSFTLNDPFKIFNPIEEDRLDVFECRVFPDLCHCLQPSETIRHLSCTRTFRRAKGCRCSDIANQVGGEGIQVLHRSLCCHFATIGIVHVNEKWSSSTSMAKCLFP